MIITNRVENVISMIVINIIFLYSLIIQAGSKTPNLGGFVSAASVAAMSAIVLKDPNLSNSLVSVQNL